MMSNRVFPAFDSGNHDNTLEIPRGPTMHTRRKNDTDEAYVSAVLPPVADDPDPHLLTLSADRIEKGMFLHSMSYIDRTGKNKLKVGAHGGEVRISLRIGGGDSQDVRTITLERFFIERARCHGRSSSRSGRTTP